MHKDAFLRTFLLLAGIHVLFRFIADLKVLLSERIQYFGKCEDCNSYFDQWTRFVMALAGHRKCPHAPIRLELPVVVTCCNGWRWIGEVFCILQFHIPDLRVGTLDSLLALTDDLTKVRQSARSSRFFTLGCILKPSVESADGILVSVLPRHVVSLWPLWES
jgi:hypothetical protein